MYHVPGCGYAINKLALRLYNDDKFIAKVPF